MKQPPLHYQDFIAQIYDDGTGTNLTTDLTFQVTENCNLACTYCYQHNKTTNKMSFETAKNFIDLILSPQSDLDKKMVKYGQSKACIIEFIGGEPFLEIDLISQITEYFIEQIILLDHPWQYNYQFVISSNGTLYFHPKVQKYLNKYKNHLSLQISLDGNKQLHDTCRVFPNGEGSYDLALKAALDWKKNKQQYLGSKLTISPNNLQYLSNAIINMIEIGYTDIFANCIYENLWTQEEAQIFYNELIKIANYILINDLDNLIYCSLFDNTIGQPIPIFKDKNYCGGAGDNLMLSINWTGQIYPCIRYMESSLGNHICPVTIGHVESGFGTNSIDLKNLNNLLSITRSSQSSSECLHCQIGEGCAWCSAWNYESANGVFNKRSTNICLMHHARVIANAYYWNFYYWKHHDSERFQINLSDDKILSIVNDKKQLSKLKVLQQYKIKIQPKGDEINEFNER